MMLLFVSLDGFISKFDISQLIGVEEVELNKYSLDLYPNPVDRTLNISIRSDRSENVEIFVYEANAKLVLRTTQMISPEKNHLIIDTESLEPGLYFVHLIGKALNKNGKFIKVY
jgi:hypothetical protein